MGGDVGPHLGRGGGRERRGRDAQLGSDTREAPVVGPEIVAPLADAVGLVDHETRGREAAKHLAEGCAPEPLGRDVEQLEASGGQLLFHPRALGWEERGMERRRGNALRAQPVDLVFHQCDERRDHDGGSIQQQRGELEAEGLPGPRRHHGHEVAPLEHCEGGLPLARAELAQTELLMERAFEIQGYCRFRHPGNLPGPAGSATTRKTARRRIRATARG